MTEITVVTTVTSPTQAAVARRPHAPTMILDDARSKEEDRGSIRTRASVSLDSPPPYVQEEEVVKIKLRLRRRRRRRFFLIILAVFAVYTTILVAILIKVCAPSHRRRCFMVPTAFVGVFRNHGANDSGRQRFRQPPTSTLGIFLNQNLR